MRTTMAVAGDNGHGGLREQMVCAWLIAGKDCSLNAVVFSFALDWGLFG